MVSDSDEFLSQIATYGVIISGTLPQIQHLRELIVDSGFKVVFQKTSLGRLYIIEDFPHDKK